jgi:hypothetical protein
MFEIICCSGLPFLDAHLNTFRRCVRPPPGYELVDAMGDCGEYAAY